MECHQCTPHARGFPQLILSLHGSLLFFTCVFLSQGCDARLPTACGREAEQSKTPSATHQHSQMGDKRNATKRTVRPGNGYWEGCGGSKQQPYSKEKVGSNTSLVWRLRPATVSIPKQFRGRWQKPSNGQTEEPAALRSFQCKLLSSLCWEWRRLLSCLCRYSFCSVQVQMCLKTIYIITYFKNRVSVLAQVVVYYCVFQKLTCREVFLSLLMLFFGIFFCTPLSFLWGRTSGNAHFCNSNYYTFFITRIIWHLFIMVLLIFSFQQSTVFFILLSYGNNFFHSHNIILIRLHLCFFCSTILASRVRQSNHSKHSRWQQHCGLEKRHRFAGRDQYWV